MNRRLLSLALSATTALTLMTTLPTSASAYYDLEGNYHNCRHMLTMTWNSTHFYGVSAHGTKLKSDLVGTLYYTTTTSSGIRKSYKAADVTAYYKGGIFSDKAYTVIDPYLCKQLYFDGYVNIFGKTKYTLGNLGYTQYVGHVTQAVAFQTETLTGIDRDEDVKYRGTLYWMDYYI